MILLFRCIQIAYNLKLAELLKMSAHTGRLFSAIIMYSGVSSQT